MNFSNVKKLNIYSCAFRNYRLDVGPIALNNFINPGTISEIYPYPALMPYPYALHLYNIDLNTVLAFVKKIIIMRKWR